MLSTKLPKDVHSDYEPKVIEVSSDDRTKKKPAKNQTS